jgi:hypothetical protein
MYYHFPDLRTSDRSYTGIDHSPLLEHKFLGPICETCCAYTLFDSSCSAKKVAETGIFFHQAQLRPGSTMTLSFPPVGEESAILPRDVAGKVPFANLDDVLATFNIAAGSAEAARVRDTLNRCQAPPIAGELKSCTTSLEATVRSAMEMLGASSHDDDVWAAASELSSVGLPRQPYAVVAASPLDGDQYASCHKLAFPYAVFQCHVSPMGYRAYKVTLRGRGQQAAVNMLAFCHLDTSGWNPALPLFEVLHTRPGGTPVCHFMPYGNLAFVKKATRRA